MPTLSSIRSRSGSRHGFAILLVLAIVVMMTLLLIALITFTRHNRVSTASYAKAIQAQEIAQGGLQDVLTDLRSEIIAGSTTHTVGTGSYATAYIPTTNFTAVPARLGYPATAWGTDIGTSTLSPSLIRVSRASQDATATHLYPTTSILNTAIYPNMAALPAGAIFNRASAANSSTPSANGRFISAAEWNKTYLLSATAQTNGGAGIQIPTTFSGSTPDWVYVTRTGSRACSVTELASLKPSSNVTQSYTITATTEPPASPVVGRYAYVVYDEGALLDTSAVGYVSGAPTAGIVTPSSGNPAGITQSVAGKTYLSYADLTQLPGLSGAAGQTAVSNLVNWRNASVTGAPNITGPNYLNAVYSYAQNGFLSFNGGDSPLLGRQDLINYFAHIDSNFNNTSASYSKALPYLGTFSRAVNAPSYSPPKDATDMGAPDNDGTGGSSVAATSPSPGFYAYKTNADKVTRSDGTFNPNLDIPNVRFPASTAAATPVTHYGDDGTTTTFNVNPGDPFVQHRFSLARLTWLTHSGPASGISAAAIQACFGLSWNSTYQCWEYVGSTGSISQSSIETLYQVSIEATPREPNFFELLKAGILNGSLGRDPGMGLADPKNPTHSGGDINIASNGVAGLYQNVYQANADPQVIQIAANIIDQYQTSSFPTAIHFPKVLPESATIPEQRLVNTAFGQKNLPFITSVTQIQGGNLTADGQTLNGWYQPELWNPYQAYTAPASAPPTKYRIHAYGQTYNTVNGVGSLNWWAPPPSPVVDYETDSYNGASTGSLAAGTGVSFIYFNDPNAGTSSSVFYNGPHYLLASDATGTPTSALNLWSATTCPDNYNQFAALYCGGIAGMVGWWPTPTEPTGPFGGPPTFFGGGTVPSVGGVYPASNTSVTAPSPPATSSGIKVGPYSWLFDATIALGAGGYYVTWSTEYYDGSQWLPYEFYSRLSCRWYEGIQAPPGPYPASNTQAASSNNLGSTLLGSTSPWNPNGTSEGWLEARSDPRTDRFSGSARAGLELSPPNVSARSFQVSGLSLSYREMGNAYPMSYPAFSLVAGNGGLINKAPYNVYDGFMSGLFAANEATAPSFSPTAVFPGNGNGGDYNDYYADPDGIVRPADGYAGDGYDSTTTGDGQEMFTPTDLSSTAQVRRPVILNHAFRSVGDIGFAYRDMPWKTVDFWSSLSADGALMDLFSVTDQPAVLAGQLSPSNSPASVLSAVISGVSQNSDAINTTVSPADSAVIATGMASAMATSPLGNRADLAITLGPATQTAMYNAWQAGTVTKADRYGYMNKANGEAAVRALSSVTNTRTWNLLIDVIAQSGHLTPNATKLDNFVVEAEKRYWLHIAIDRYTGKIVDQQLEPVYE